MILEIQLLRGFNGKWLWKLISNVKALIVFQSKDELWVKVGKKKKEINIIYSPISHFMRHSSAKWMDRKWMSKWVLSPLKTGLYQFCILTSFKWNLQWWYWFDFVVYHPSWTAFSLFDKPDNDTIAMIRWNGLVKGQSTFSKKRFDYLHGRWVLSSLTAKPVGSKSVPPYMALELAIDNAIQAQTYQNEIIFSDLAFLLSTQ